MESATRDLVLIVDDHADTRELHLLLITDAGYRCVAAETTDEGLRLARLTRFDAELVKPVDPHEVLAAVNRATNT